MEKKHDYTNHAQASIEEIAAILHEISRNKKLIIEDVTNNQNFKKAFENIFKIGVSHPGVQAYNNTMRIRAVPSFGDNNPEEAEWVLEFSVKAKEQGKYNWRIASTSEIISCWDQFYPLIQEIIRKDRINTKRLARSVDKLKELLAPDIMTNFLESNTPYTR